MHDPRLTPFFNASCYFLDKAMDVNDCLIEFQKTQKMLTELIMLESDLKCKYEQASLDMEVFLADKRDAIYTVMSSAGVKPSERVLDDRVIRNHSIEYKEKKEKVDSSKIDYEAANSLKMAMFQRKDAICHTIEYIRTHKEADSCIMKNKQLLHRLGVILDEQHAGKSGK